MDSFTYTNSTYREIISRAAEALIDLLDAFEGDADAEETGAEDSFMEHPADGPGCPCADPDKAADDEEEIDDGC